MNSGCGSKKATQKKSKKPIKGKINQDLRSLGVASFWPKSPLHISYGALRPWQSLQLFWAPGGSMQLLAPVSRIDGAVFVWTCFEGRLKHIWSRYIFRERECLKGFWWIYAQHHSIRMKHPCDNFVFLHRVRNLEKLFLVKETPTASATNHSDNNIPKSSIASAAPVLRPSRALYGCSRRAPMPRPSYLAAPSSARTWQASKWCSV